MTHRGSSFDAAYLVSQSPVDLRVRSEMWHAHVPVVMHLAAHEVTSMEDPPPLALLLPRQSYLPLVLQEVRTHFRDMTPAIEDELWLEYDGIPLKWTLPIGVLFDLLCPSVDSSSSSMLLPWRLTVHFQSFPANKLQRCKSLFTVRQHYLNTWKESCYLRFASSRIAMSCQQTDHQRMWDALLQLREDVHTQTNARIVMNGILGAQQAQQQQSGSATTPTSASSSAQQPQANTQLIIQAALENRSVEDLPIRIYLHCTRAQHEEGMNSDNHMCPIQRSIKPKNKSGHETTLQDLVQQVLPTLIDTTKSNAATSTSPSTVQLQSNVRLMIQGLQPPLSTPLSWLVTYASHPDGFLYVAVQIHEVETEEERLERDPFSRANTMTGVGGVGVGGIGGSDSLSQSMFGASYGNLGGMMNSVASFTPASIPGYYAASNAMNVVYQALPFTVPSLPQVTLPSMTQLFGTTTIEKIDSNAQKATAAAAAPSSSSSASTNDLPESPEIQQGKVYSQVPLDQTAIMRGGEVHEEEMQQQQQQQQQRLQEDDENTLKPPALTTTTSTAAVSSEELP